jgi:hypothetical protein
MGVSPVNLNFALAVGPVGWTAGCGGLPGAALDIGVSTYSVKLVYAVCNSSFDVNLTST